jgi:hypothetical protein
VWLALIRAEWVHDTWVMCPNGASGKPCNIPEYVALHWHRQLCQGRLLFLPYSWDKNGLFFFETEQGAAATADLLQYEPHVEVVDLKPSVASSDEERLTAGISAIGLQTNRLSGA